MVTVTFAISEFPLQHLLQVSLKDYYKIPTKLPSSILTAESCVEQIWILNKNFLNFIESSGVSIVK